MNRYRALSAALIILAFLGTKLASADTIPFNLVYTQGQLTPTTAPAILNLELQIDGTIAASVTADAAIFLVGYNAPGFNVSLENNTPTGYIPTSSSSPFGSWLHGISNFTTPETSISWTIGSPGMFTSLEQIESFQGAQATPDATQFFLLLSDDTLYGGNAAQATPAPEPSSAILLIVGLICGLKSSSVSSD